MGQKPEYIVRLIGAGIVTVLLAALVAGCSSPAPIGVTNTPSPAPSATPATTATPSPVATPTVLPTATPSPSPSPTPTPLPGIVQSYQWLYKGKLYQFQLAIPQSSADHYRSLPHSAGSGYGAYGISSLDRPYLPADTLKSAVQSNGFGVSDAAMLVQAFVQSLQNTPGRDDSPKYPVETVLDKGGDSEDTSILAAALLNDMGFDAVLLSFPGHMAVGIKGTGDLYGRYYQYNGADYYYLETAIPGYEFGAIPDEYRNVSTTIYTMTSSTSVAVSATSEKASEDQLSVYYKVSCIVGNAGSESAKGVSVHFTSLALNYGPEQEWQISAQDVSVGDLAAGESRTIEATVKVPRSGDTQLECIVSGDNFVPAVWKGERFTL